MALNITDETEATRLEQTQTSKEEAVQQQTLGNKGNPRYSIENQRIKYDVFSSSETKLQIGPLVYGGEVQDIQIVENKLKNYRLKLIKNMEQFQVIIMLG